MNRLLFALLLAACGTAFAQPARMADSQPIPGRYIVVYKDSVADPQADSDRKVRAMNGRRHHAFTRALKGFSATLSDEAVARLRQDPDVAYIEQDQTVHALGLEDQAPWGLDRIDQADRPLDTQYHWNYTGAGVYAFIIDTGIRTTHSEFTGRTAPGFTSITDGGGTNDCDGHGTHVAGTVGGSVYGVAKGVTLVPVRVLDCTGSGTWSGVIAGIDWVAKQTSMRPAVANMSLGGGKSTSVNDAVARAVAAGVTMVVAAGNENVNACNKSPASEPSAITVGATSSNDARASFSNYGSCVDLFAPGVSIKSAWNTSDTATSTISGTSMATPHTTGVAALALEASPTASATAVTNFLLANATVNRLASIGTGSPNKLLFSLAAGAPTEPVPPTIAVKSLGGTRVRAGAGWAARATIGVRDVATGAAVVNAKVTGSFAPGGSGQCTTASTGTCSITSATLPKSTPSTVFTVDGVSATGATYDASQNSASQVTISNR